MVSKRALISLIFLLYISTAGAVNEYRTTYTIDVRNDGSAVWYVEYRTPLVTKEDVDAFENYTKQIKSVYLNEFRELMHNSVSTASNATSRKMTAGDFTGSARIETAPTGKYGVVHYSFTWTDFSKLDSDKNINIGDVFVGGLYLSKDNALMIRYPSGYSVEQVAPQPDLIRDGMIWYGLRSFNPGEPSILLKPHFSWMPYAFAVIIAAAAGGVILRIRRKAKVIDIQPGYRMESTDGTNTEMGTGTGTDTGTGMGTGTDTGTGMGTGTETDTGTGADIMDLEERIAALLKESGGALYQSDIVKKLDLPKSTVSSALNGLHARNIIQKIKKGRENLIRLVSLSDKI